MSRRLRVPATPSLAGRGRQAATAVEYDSSEQVRVPGRRSLAKLCSLPVSQPGAA